MSQASYGSLTGSCPSAASLRPQIARMLLIKQLMRSGEISREQAAEAIRAGHGPGPGLPRLLVIRGWVSPQRMTEALASLRDTMIQLD